MHKLEYDHNQKISKHGQESFFSIINISFLAYWVITPCVLVLWKANKDDITLQSGPLYENYYTLTCIDGSVDYTLVIQ